MSLKSKMKSIVVGRPGKRVRTIRIGLLRGLKFHVDTESQSMRLLGLAESEISRYTRELSHKAKSALDIGSNDGWYALYFAAQKNIEKVIGFDANEDVLKVARENIALNPECASKVNLMAKMVGEKNSGDTCSVDSLGALPEPILLKIDVDGGEMDVLRGGRETLAFKECLLIVETHTAELERQCIAFLTELGYKCRIIGQGWYRTIFPESRHIEHNRWFIATKEKPQKAQEQAGNSNR